jgi:hypothetical protein
MAKSRAGTKFDFDPEKPLSGTIVLGCCQEASNKLLEV